MADELEDQPLVKLGLAGALAREYAADHRVFLQLFAKAIEQALPGDTELLWRGGFLSKKEIKGFTLTLEPNRYTLEDHGKGRLVAQRTHIVRGIALKTEEIPVEKFLEEVGAALEEQVGKSGQARAALAAFMGLS